MGDAPRCVFHQKRGLIVEGGVTLFVDEAHAIASAVQGSQSFGEVDVVGWVELGFVQLEERLASLVDEEGGFLKLADFGDTIVELTQKPPSYSVATASHRTQQQTCQKGLNLHLKSFLKRRGLLHKHEVEDQCDKGNDTENNECHLHLVKRIVAMHFTRPSVDDELISLAVNLEHANPQREEDEFEHEVGIEYPFLKDALLITANVLVDVLLDGFLHLLLRRLDSLGEIDRVDIGGEARRKFGRVVHQTLQGPTFLFFEDVLGQILRGWHQNVVEVVAHSA